MKRGLLALTVLLISTSLVSAQVSLGEFFNKFGGENLFLLGTFLISFVFINFILSRVPIFHNHKTNEENKMVPGVIALVLSLMIVYGIYKTDFNIENLFSNFGITADVLQTIVAIVLLIAIIYGFKKLKSWTFLILGAALVIISFTELVYETQVVLTAGAILIGIWLVTKMFFKKKKKRQVIYRDDDED